MEARNSHVRLTFVLFCLPQASVALLCEVGLYTEAVATALSFDPDLATSIARGRGDAGDAPLARKLWLEIAAHTIACGVRQGEGAEGAEEVRCCSTPPFTAFGLHAVKHRCM